MIMEEFERRKEEVLKNSPNVLVAIEDTLVSFVPAESVLFQNVDTYISIIDNNQNNELKSAVIDLEKIQVPNGFEFQLESVIDDEYRRFKQSGKRKFGGYLGFSKIYFNEDSTKALVFVRQDSFGDGGTGYMMLLSMNSGQWDIEEKLMHYIS
jgi:hypothetical protein